jgi:cardiolipin synthase
VNELWRGWLHARADVTLGIGVVLAILVTLHVLLRKREVTSAVGWIGLVWFAPILGAIGYFVLGINRVRRRARLLHKPDTARGSRIEPPSLHVTGDLAQLDRSIGRITARPLVAGTAVRNYHNGDEAYPAMLAAIAAAKRSIGLSSYIFRDDCWGGHFIAALVSHVLDSAVDL